MKRSHWHLIHFLLQ